MMALVDDIIKFADNFKNKDIVPFKPVLYCDTSLVDDAKKHLPGYEIVELKMIEVR